MAVEPLARRRLPRAPRSLAPWGINDVVRIYLSTGLSVILIVAGWWGASGTIDTATQTAWTAVSIGGLIIAGTGNALWLLHGRRAVAEQQRRLLSLPVTARAETAPRREEARPTEDVVVATDTMTRYHRPDCPLVAGKDVRAAEVRDHQQKGRRPCGVCTP